eukprot:GILJ01008636.1.p1 GENE.GILJ01008636.1~~GILJ01008636.1.p1  ORF type:complete len:776 (+),score=84.22 GILJ01008636.1:21-2348(+)
MSCSLRLLQPPCLQRRISIFHVYSSIYKTVVTVPTKHIQHASPRCYGVPTLTQQMSKRGVRTTCRIGQPLQNLHVRQHSQSVKNNQDFEWMRNPQDLRVKAFFERHNNKYAAFVKQTRRFSGELVSEMSIPIDADPVSEIYGNYSYYSKHLVDKPIPIFCRKKVGQKYGEEVLLDATNLPKFCYQSTPHEQNEESSFVSIGVIKVDPHTSQKLLMAIDTTGEENYRGFIKDLNTDVISETEIIPSCISMDWSPDGQSIFYTVPDSLRRPYKVMQHRLGTPVSEDRCLLEEFDDSFFVDLHMMKDMRYLSINLNSKTTGEVYLLDMAESNPNPILVERRQPGIEYYLEHRGDKFYIITNADGAENFKIVTAPDSTPQRSHWKDVITVEYGAKIEDVDMFQNYCVVYEKFEGLPRVRVISFVDDSTHFLPLPDSVCRIDPGVNQTFNSDTLRLTYTSPLVPRIVYDYDMRSRKLSKLQSVVLNAIFSFNANHYTCRRVHIESEDGSQVPMTLVHKKNISTKRNNPVLMIGYGAYGTNVEPGFQIDKISLLQRGWIIAIAHVRGGGELGRRWYNEGRLDKKKNTFIDFVACAKWMIEEGYSRPELMAAEGTSAGGFLMGWIANNYPWLFRALIMRVPFVDVLSTMLDRSLPLTIHEYEEWGDARKPEVYETLRALSPFENLSAQQYPHLMVTTALNDPRVPFWGPAKYVAKMEQMVAGDTNATDGTVSTVSTTTQRDEPRMLLLKIDPDAGHFGNGDFRVQKAEEYAFLFKALGLKMK